MARAELDALHDDLFVLSCAVADTKRDLAEGLEPEEAMETLRWLLDAALPFAERRMPAK